VPTLLRVFRVFVASPGDLKPEREALETAIDELNQTTGITLGIRLDLIRWETFAHPAMGADPQTVINEQVGDNFDIFIGMLWCRLGQPTPRGESGTVEEFERALARRAADPSSVELLIYFKDAPISPSRIDAAQLQKVQTFRERIEKDGLVATFSSTDELLTAVRIHLTRVLQTWDTREVGHKLTPLELSVQESNSTPEPEEPGFIDLIEAGTDNFGLTTSAAERIAASITDLGNSTREAAVKLGEIEGNTPARLVHMKRIVNAVAERMGHFALALRADIAILRDAFSKAIQSIESAAGLLPDFKGDPSAELEGNILMLENLETTIQTTRQQIEDFRHTVEGTPRMSTQFNRAKRSTSEALEELEMTLDEQIRLVNEARKLQETLLEQHRPVT